MSREAGNHITRRGFLIILGAVGVSACEASKKVRKKSFDIPPTTIKSASDSATIFTPPLIRTTHHEEYNLITN